jgi:hypothetical protein
VAVFPPPQPWRQVAPVDPEREYVAFTSRFLPSLLRVPAFVRQSLRIQRQAKAAPGIVGWSLAMNLPRLEFFTLSAWTDEASLKAFVGSGGHAEALGKFAGQMRAKSTLVRFT